MGREARRRVPGAWEVDNEREAVEVGAKTAAMAAAGWRRVAAGRAIGARCPDSPAISAWVSAGIAFAQGRGAHGYGRHHRGRVRAPRPDADHAARARREAPGDLPRVRRRTLGTGAAAVRRRGVLRVFALRGAGPRLRKGALRRVRPRHAGGVLVQTARRVPVVRRAADVPDRSDSVRSGAAGRAAAAVGAERSVRAPERARGRFGDADAGVAGVLRGAAPRVPRGERDRTERRGEGRSGGDHVCSSGRWFAQSSCASACHRSGWRVALRDGRLDAGVRRDAAGDGGRPGRRARSSGRAKQRGTATA